MNAQTLRDLSRAYAAGNIDREAYRRQRRELLRRIVAGEEALVPYRRPDPDAPTVFPSVDDEGDTTQEIIPGAATIPRSRGGGRRRWSLLLVVALLVGGGWGALDYALRHAAPVPEAPAEAPAAPDIFDGYLAADGWHDASMQALRAAWDALDAPERAALAGGESARRLGAAILERLRAESALLELGDADTALETQGALLDLAEYLGLPDPRLAAARSAWLAEHARRAATTAGAAADAATLVATTDAAGASTVPSDAPPAEPAAEAAAEPLIAPAPTEPRPEAGTEQAALPTEVPAPQAAQPSPEPAPATSPPPARTATSTAGTASAGGASRSNCSGELARTRQPYCIDVAGKFRGPALVVLPAGRYAMGGSEASEQPHREVTIAAPFALGMFEVSAGEFAAYCAASGVACPAQPWDDPALPVVNVSWHDALAYADWLSGTTGRRYRLPTEAEWEYAVRAGSTTAYPAGDELLPTHARFSFKQAETAPLRANDRSLNRNAFRLFHMLGNVREWVLDHWAGNYAGAPAAGDVAVANASAERVVRGGSYADGAAALRSAARTALAAGTRDAYTGFRVARLIE